MTEQYRILDTDNNAVLIPLVTGTYADAVRAALDRCDVGEQTMDEAVAGYIANVNASEAYGISIERIS